MHACMHAYIHTYIHTLHTYILTLHYITLHYISLHYITLHYIAKNQITQQNIDTYILTYLRTYIHTLHFTTLHYLKLHHITLHYIHTYGTYIHTYIHYLTLPYLTLPYLTLHYITYIHASTHTFDIKIPNGKVFNVVYILPLCWQPALVRFSSNFLPVAQGCPRCDARKEQSPGFTGPNPKKGSFRQATTYQKCLVALTPSKKRRRLGT